MERKSAVRVVITTSSKDDLWWLLNNDTLAKKGENREMPWAGTAHSLLYCGGNSRNSNISTRRYCWIRSAQ